MPKTPAERFAGFLERQKAKGLKLVTVWVPADKLSALKDFVRKLREE